MRRAKTLAALAVAAAMTGAACGGGQTTGSVFDTNWSNDGGAGVAAFQKRFAGEKVPANADVAVGVVGRRTLVGLPLDGGATWTYTHALESRPAVAGTVVVGMGRGELFALDARTGKPLWKRNAGGLLRGAGDDGRTTVVSLAASTGRGSTVLAISHDGEVVRQLEDDALVGVPAVVDGYAFIPWAGQYVTVYDLLGGHEEARVLLRAQTSRAFTVGGAIFFGEAGATRLDDRIGASAEGRATTVNLPARELPGTPRWLPPGTDIPPVKAGARERIRLYARPAATGPAAIEGGRFAATYFRIAVGFDAQAGGIAWAHAHDAEFLDGAAYAGGFALCDDKGRITFLDGKNGGVAGQVSMNKALDACVVQVDALSRPAGPPGPPLAEQLAKTIMMPEAEHATIQKLLLRELAALSDESVTKALIDLASSERTPPMLLDEARKLLAARRNGVTHMLAALERHYDYLADVLRPPPVGPLADALAAMNEPRAAPLLAVHLNDPVSTPDDLQRASVALVQLAGKGEHDRLATFFAHYRGMAEGEAVTSAVVAAAQALVKVGGTKLVAAAADDPFTLEPLRERFRNLAKQPGADKPKDEPKKDGAKDGKADTTKGAAPKVDAPKAAPGKSEPPKPAPAPKTGDPKKPDAPKK